MKILDSALAAVRSGETRIVTVVGPSGVGKTRLIHDFIYRNRAPRALAASGAQRTSEVELPPPRIYRGSARDTAASYGLFARLFRARMNLVEGMDPAAAAAQVRAEVDKVLPSDKDTLVVHYLCQLLGLPVSDGPLSRAIADDPEQAEIMQRAVVKTFLEADAARSPICLFFDDLHFAHDDSLTLLRYLTRYLAGPILMLAAARPDLLARREDWADAGEPRHTVIELGPLTDEDASVLMEELLAACEGGPPQALIDAACAFAGGSPLLLEQMVRIYRDKGVIQDATDPDEIGEEPRLRVNLHKLDTAALPITIEDAVNARITALDPPELRLLEQAAAMGSVFWSGAFTVLARAGHDAPDLWTEDADKDARATAELLADLVERDYILKLPDSSFAGSEEYVFKHNRERETIAQRALPSALKRWHTAIADWMEHQATLRTSEEQVAMLAGHRERGGDPVRAGLAYLEAGDVARSRYATTRAAEYYEHGLRLLGDAHAHRRIDALHHYGDVLQRAGKVEDAIEAFREMLSLSYQLDLRTKGGAAHNRLGRVYRDTGALDEASRHLRTGLELFRGAGDERGVASSIDDIGKLHWLKGEYEPALEWLKDGLARRRKLADRRSIALSLNNIGLVQQDSGEFKRALESFEQALAIRRDIGDLPGIAVTLNNLGTVAQDQRDFMTALAAFHEALDVAKQIGDRNRTALVLTNIGECHYRSGRPGEAIEVLTQAEELCDELGDKLGLAEVLRGLGKAHMLKGDLAKARDAISRAVDLFAAVRSKVHLGLALRTLGEITAAGGWGSAHAKSAREYFTRAVAIFEETGNDLELARTFKVFSRFLFDVEGTEEARREAIGINTRAEAIFTRLKITTGPVELGATGRESRPT